SLAPMILGGKLPGKVGRCRFFISIKTYDGIKNCAECEALAPFLFGSALAEHFLFFVYAGSACFFYSLNYVRVVV
ncbi:MAG: hypothetical protein IKU09_08670, partial [Firmicutes bacterium]|nr:hypothetical protein [Bacillota bacterium]